MHRVIWNGVTIAESKDVTRHDGAFYFPRAHVKAEHLVSSGIEGKSPFKGRTVHFDVNVLDHVAPMSAWMYLSTTEKTAHLDGRIGFQLTMVERPKGTSSNARIVGQAAQ